MEEKRILIICDSLDFLWISKALRRRYVLEWAGNREDLSKYGDRVDFDLLLIDIALLRADSNLSERFAAKHIPVIALSSEPYDTKDKSLLKAGCSACYIKPFRQDMFAALVGEWIK